MKLLRKSNRGLVAATCLLVSIPIAGMSYTGSAAAPSAGGPTDGGIHLPPDIAKRIGALYKPTPGPGYNLLVGIPVSARSWEIKLTTAAEKAGLRDGANAAAADITKATGVAVTVSGTPVSSSYEPAAEEVLVNSANDHYGGPCGDGKTPWVGCGGPTHFVKRDNTTFIDGGKVTVRSGTKGTNYIREVLDHEIGHVFALHHFDDQYRGRYQVMRSSTTGSPAYKEGDTNGLRNVLDLDRPPALDSSIPGQVIAAGHKVDFDGDGRSDVFARQGDGRWVYSSGGVTSWKSLRQSDVKLVDLRFGDFNGDRKTDVFTRRWDGQWMYSSGGTSEWLNMAQSQIALNELRFGDFNGDGKTDVFARESDGRWMYSPSGHLAWKRVATSQTPLKYLRFGDFDGDGKTDVFSRENAGRWKYSSAATGRWKNLGTSQTPLEYLRFGDFDGDRKTDVFSREGNGRWKYSSGAAGKWKNLGTSSTPLNALRFGDFDGDGKTDPFAAGGDGRWKYSPGAVAKWKNLNLSKTPLTDLRIQ